VQFLPARLAHLLEIHRTGGIIGQSDLPRGAKLALRAYAKSAPGQFPSACQESYRPSRAKPATRPVRNWPDAQANAPETT
jgi:hypothetical protein